MLEPAGPGGLPPALSAQPPPRPEPSPETSDLVRGPGAGTRRRGIELGVGVLPPSSWGRLGTPRLSPRCTALTHRLSCWRQFMFTAGVCRLVEASGQKRRGDSRSPACRPPSPTAVPPRTLKGPWLLPAPSLPFAFQGGVSEAAAGGRDPAGGVEGLLRQTGLPAGRGARCGAGAAGAAGHSCPGAR